MYAKSNRENNNVNTKNDETIFQKQIKYTWSENKLPNYNARWKHKEIKEIKVDFDKAISENNTDDAVHYISKTIQYVCNGMCKPVKKSRHEFAYSRNNWFDEECLEYKQYVKTCLNKFRRSHEIIHLNEYKYNKRKYKTMIKRKKALYFNKKRTDIIKAFTENDNKSFWSKLKEPKEN